MARGRLVESARFHPLGPLTFAGAVATAVLPEGTVERSIARYPRGVICFGVLWVGVWVGRLVLEEGRRVAARRSRLS